APAAIAADATADGVAGIAAVLPQLAPKRRQLRRAAMERSVALGRSRRDGPSDVLCGVARERGPAAPDCGRRVRVAVPDPGQFELLREPDNPAMPRPPQRRGVEGLERIGAEARVGLAQQPAEDEALGAERVRDQWMGRDRETTLVVDRGDRRAQRPQGPHPLLQEEAQQMAAERRDLLA